MKEDQLIAENPCRIPGYDKEVSPERPVGTIPQVIALSELSAPRFRALVLLAAFTGLRLGELVAVRRCDLDLDAGTVRISRKFAELRDGRRVAGPPKSAAGVRVVALPAMLVDAMKRHLAEFPAEVRVWSSAAPLVPRCVATTFIDRFAGHRALCRRAFRPDSTSTIYATLATTSQRQAAPAPAS